MRCVLFLLCFLCSAASADKEVSVDVKSYVDPSLNIVCLDSHNGVDLFQPKPLRFAIFSNTDQSIILKADSTFKAVHETDNTQHITYELDVKEQNGTSNTLSSSCSELEISADKFDDKRLDIAVTAKCADPNEIKTLLAGQYRGSYTLKVSTKI